MTNPERQGSAREVCPAAVELAANPFADPRAARRIGIRQQHGEFLAAISGGEIRGSLGFRAKILATARRHSSPAGCPYLSLNDLELVDDRSSAATGMCARDRLASIPRPAARRTGGDWRGPVKPSSMASVSSLLLQILLLRHVARDRDHAIDLAGDLARDAQRQFDPDLGFLAVPRAVGDARLLRPRRASSVATSCSKRAADPPALTPAKRRRSDESGRAPSPRYAATTAMRIGSAHPARCGSPCRSILPRACGNSLPWRQGRPPCAVRCRNCRTR